MSLLEVRDLSVRYHTKKGDVKALNNIWFRLERGKVLGVLGESGCGKTTLAYSIVRILPPNARITSGNERPEPRTYDRIPITRRHIHA